MPDEERLCDHADCGIHVFINAIRAALGDEPLKSPVGLCRLAANRVQKTVKTQIQISGNYRSGWFPYSALALGKA